MRQGLQKAWFFFNMERGQSASYPARLMQSPAVIAGN